MRGRGTATVAEGDIGSAVRVFEAGIDSCVSPGPDNVEGLIYIRKRYIQRSSFLTFQFEMIFCPVLFASAATLLLF